VAALTRNLECMIYLIPVLNALFGWLMISLLVYFLFHPRKRKNLFIIDWQGFIPKNFDNWVTHLGKYAAENLVNIPQMKESLLKGERLTQINSMLEKKVDDFLRNKLKEKIPVISMFITEGMVSKMKEVLMAELEKMVPAAIDQIAAGVEQEFDVQKLISEKMSAWDTAAIENVFRREAGKGILSLKLVVAFLGFALGWLEVALLKI
jgi:uncharacterized membrane protein YheB (UPF0754 family)